MRSTSLQTRTAFGVALLVSTTCLLFFAGTMMAARAFYFELRVESMEAVARSVRAVVQAAGADHGQAAAALDEMIAATPDTGPQGLLVRRGTRIVARAGLSDADIAAIDAGLPGDESARSEILLAGGDHEVLRRVHEGPNGRLEVVVADPDRDIFQRRRREILRATAVLAAAVALGIAGAWWVVSAGMRPLRRLAISIDGIADDPTDRGVPVPSTVPRELQPLVAAIAALLRRLGVALERERRFAADAAHDLRTPVAGIRSSIELARQRRRDPERDASTLADLGQACERLEQLTGQLLALASADAAKPVAGTLATDLLDAARIAIDETTAEAAARDVTLTLDASDLETSQRLLVPIDTSSSVRLVRNLVENAIRHGPSSGQVTVRVRRAIEGDTPYVEVRVHDDGTSLRQVDVPTCFERFARVGWRERGDHPPSGTGLGLSIVQSIARSAGGVATGGCDRDGTWFAVRLPEVSAEPKA